MGQAAGRGNPTGRGAGGGPRGANKPRASGGLREANKP